MSDGYIVSGNYSIKLIIHSFFLFAFKSIFFMVLGIYNSSTKIMNQS